jgi:hypothetical protein
MYKINTSNLLFPIPEVDSVKISDGKEYVIRAENPDYGYVHLIFKRQREFNKLTPTESSKNYNGKIDNFYFKKRDKAVFTPIDLDDYLESNGIVNDVNNFERKKFELNGREGYHLIPKKEYANEKDSKVVFVATTEQSDESMNKAFLVGESLCNTLAGRKQELNKDEKRNNSFRDNIKFHVCSAWDDIKNCTELNKVRESHFYNSNNSGKIIEENVYKEIAKEQIKLSVKKVPKVFLKGVLASLFPLLGVYFKGKSLVNGVRLFKHWNSIGNKAYNSSTYNPEDHDDYSKEGLEEVLEDLNNEIIDTEEDLDELKEDYESQTGETASDDYDKWQDDYEDEVSDSQTQVNNALSQVDTGELDSLDDFMIRNDITPVDSDSDGYTDFFTYEDNIIDNPFTYIDPETEELMLQRGVNIPAEEYDLMLQEWNDLQNYEIERNEHNLLTATYETFMQSYLTLVDLRDNRISVNEVLSERISQLNEFTNNMIEDGGIIISLLSMTGLGIIYSFATYNKKIRTEWGSKVAVLKKEQVKRLRSNYKINITYSALDNYLLKIKSLSEGNNDIDKKIKEKNKDIKDLESEILSNTKHTKEWIDSYNIFLDSFSNELKEKEVFNELGKVYANLLIDEDTGYDLGYFENIEEKEVIQLMLEWRSRVIKNKHLTKEDKENEEFYKQYVEFFKKEWEEKTDWKWDDKNIYSKEFVNQELKGRDILNSFRLTCFETPEWKDYFKDDNTKKELIQNIIDYYDKPEKGVKNPQIIKDAYMNEIRELEMKKEERINNFNTIKNEKMPELLIQNPYLILTELYKGFGGKYNTELINIVSKNNNIKKTRKKIEKIIILGNYIY